jgi:S1/P1 Nuclease
MWATESFEISKSTVYNGVQPNVALSSQYQSAAVAAIEKQIVVGGYRLAYMIQHIFGTAAAPTSFLQ